MIKERPLNRPARDAQGAPSRKFGGRGVRRVSRRNRDDLYAFARAGEIEFPARIEDFDRLVRYADALSPERLNRLRGEMAELEQRWNELAADDRVSVAEWIESICSPWIVARTPMRVGGMGPSWFGDFVLALLTDFDASGQVTVSVDRGWNRPSRKAKDVLTTARLAVAAGWTAWSHLIVDPELAESALNVLGELADRLESLANAGAPFSAADRGWTLAALTLEERLVRHWLPGRGSIH